MTKRRAMAALSVERRSFRPRPAGQQGDRDAPGRWLPSFGPSGHVGASAHSTPAADRTGSAPQRQRSRAVLQTGPSLRRRILKPCVLAVKIARCARVAARSLRASGPLRRRDSEDACRRDGQDRALPHPVAAICSSRPGLSRLIAGHGSKKVHVTHGPDHTGRAF